jgi:pimeloyl-ACP methyl ester carboxylesterase
VITYKKLKKSTNDIMETKTTTKINTTDKQTIIFIHGLGASNFLVQKKVYGDLIDNLSKEYKVIVFTWDKDKLLKDIADDLRKLITKSKVNEAHFICHSFGAVILRFYCQKPNCKVKKVVLIGPVVNGSRLLAYSFKNHPDISKKLLGLASKEFLDTQKTILELPLPDGMLVIAGSKKFEKGTPESYLQKFDSALDLDYSDGKVFLDETKASNMKEHFVLNEYHNYLPGNKKVISKIEEFLKE